MSNRSEYLDLIRLISNLLVVFIHSWGFSAYCPHWARTFEGLFWAWFVDAARIAMPTLFILSGYLLFRNYGVIVIGSKIESRIKRLLLPYCCWNVFYLSLFLCLAYVGIMRNPHLAEKGIFAWSFENLFSFTSDPACPPMWYVRAIFVYSLLAPILFIIAQRKIGLICIIIVILTLGAYTMHTGFDVNCWTTYPYYSVLAFGVGGLLSKRKFLEKKFMTDLRFGVLSLVTGLISLFACQKFVAIQGGVLNPSGLSGFIIALLRVFSSGIVFGIGSFMMSCHKVSMTMRIFQKSSFFLYAIHYGLLVILIPCIGKLSQIIPMPHGTVLTMMMLCGFICCVVVSHLIWWGGKCLVPKVTSFFDGTLK